MLMQFIYKEIVETIFGPKFVITFLISLILVISSVMTGYQLYKMEMDWQAKAIAMNKDRLSNLGSYGYLKEEGSKALREPERMSIFVKGVDSAIGRSATIDNDPNIILRDSRFGLNPVFAVFGELDLAFIVKMIISLFALLYSYNAISGERESGTLKLIFSNRVNRATYILGKGIGGIVPLLLTLVIPFLIALLLLNILGLNFSIEEYGRIASLLLVFSLYIIVFYMIGMLMSALTRSSMVSFLLCLFVWVLCVAVLPKIAVEAASYISPAPSVDELEARRTALRRQYYSSLQDMLNRRLLEAVKANKPREELAKIRDQAQEESRALIADEERKLLDDYHRSQLGLLNMATILARISPTSCVTFASNRLALTDASLSDRFLEGLARFRTRFVDYADEKINLYRKDHPELTVTGVSTSISVDDSDGVRNVSVNVYTPSSLIDVNDIPVFLLDRENLSQSFYAIIIDIAILSFMIVLFFAAAFVSFIRYDVR